ncbi:MAG: hypothetical protein JW909_09045 [Planctomycetes bacterium]|nr:hypothetical protein [Planctomycetota bacterium]
MTPPQNLPDAPDEAHEALCRKCGKCCRRKVLVGRRVVYMQDYCRFLDTSTMLCRIYERRFQLNPSCKTVSAAIRMGILPADCPYVQGVKDYVPPVEDWDSAEADGILDGFTRESRPSGDLTSGNA